jgi:glycosyltransferase involved in cell wall biosynthesis
MEESRFPVKLKLSIVIPAYNEKNTIWKVVQQVKAVNLGLETELIVVDDHSTDGTSEVLDQLAKENSGAANGRIRVVRHDKNRGKGAAVRTGMRYATGDVVLIQDADLEYDPSDYPELVKPILENRADVVYGNRFHGGSHRVLYYWHYLGNRLLTNLCNALSNINLSDVEVGYKVFRRSLLTGLKLESNRFGFDPEITIKVARIGARIYEVPISYHGRTYAEGKKITWKDGVAAIYFMLKYSMRWTWVRSEVRMPSTSNLKGGADPASEGTRLG